MSVLEIFAIVRLAAWVFLASLAIVGGGLLAYFTLATMINIHQFEADKE